jgi:hypothetical protein
MSAAEERPNPTSYWFPTLHVVTRLVPGPQPIDGASHWLTVRYPCQHVETP